MKILCIDTSTRAGLVALCSDAELVAELRNEQQLTHSEWLFSAIETSLCKAGWNRRDLEGIAVAIGPGSFTGLRIGLAAAKGVALGLEIPIAGVSSLQLLSSPLSDREEVAVPLIDAGRGEIYGSLKGRERVFPPEELARQIVALNTPTILVGDGALRYAAHFAGEGMTIPPPESPLHRPDPHHLARLALWKLKRGEDPDLIPNYIRLSDAEIGFQGR